MRYEIKISENETIIMNFPGDEYYLPVVEGMFRGEGYRLDVMSQLFRPVDTPKKGVDTVVEAEVTVEKMAEKAAEPVKETAKQKAKKETIQETKKEAIKEPVKAEKESVKSDMGVSDVPEPSVSFDEIADTINTIAETKDKVKLKQLKELLVKYGVKNASAMKEKKEAWDDFYKELVVIGNARCSC